MLKEFVRKCRYFCIVLLFRHLLFVFFFHPYFSFPLKNVQAVEESSAKAEGVAEKRNDVYSPAWKQQKMKHQRASLSRLFNRIELNIIRKSPTFLKKSMVRLCKCVGSRHSCCCSTFGWIKVNIVSLLSVSALFTA